MPKVLIVISSDIYVRNYLTTDALSSLENQFECHFLADEGISLKKMLEDKPGFQGFYSIDDSLQKKHRLLFNIMMWRHRKKSRTFLYRWMRNSHWYLVDRSHGVFRYISSILRWFLSASRNPEGLIVPLLGNRVFFPFTSRILQRQIPINDDLQSRISQESYDLVIFPSAAFDAASVDIARVCEQLGTPSLCLIDNWDNLSSKTVFWARPTHLGVWGPQAREQAIRIHGFEHDQIHEIGTPRFDQYFSARSKPTNPIYEFPYVLFVGSAMPFDEISALHKIENFILRSTTLPSDLRVVYRPHPWQQKRKVTSAFSCDQFSKVVLDRQIEHAQRPVDGRSGTGTDFQPELSYYPNLLLNASCVVGPLTTMLLEASLCLRPVIGINFNDGVHNNTSRRYFSHFDGAEKIPGFFFCDTPEDLGHLIEHSMLMGPISEKESDGAISYFVHQSSLPYPERLLAVATTVIE